MKKIDELIEQLSPELQDEVFDFAQFLLEKKTQPKQKKLRMSWAGRLKEFRFVMNLHQWNFKRNLLNGGAFRA